MNTWSTHHLLNKARDQFVEEIALNISNYAENLRQKSLPVIFSLGHLSKITGIEYSILHDTVNRKREAANYNVFAISKRAGGKRYIHAVNGKMLPLLRYINNDILQKTTPHPASFAFHPSGGIRRCAEKHCGARWLFQFDLKDFFYHISEPAVYSVFRSLGYKKLLSFELARICTTVRLPGRVKPYLRKRHSPDRNSIIEFGMPYPHREAIGVLPQGAPTSPMLSNLVSNKLDESLTQYARSHGMVYTRYADDLTFSASELPSGTSIGKIRKDILFTIRGYGFWENKQKIRIAGPGSKKLVLGLLVDGEQPRLSRQTRSRIDRLLYATKKFGLTETARHEGFDSAYGFFNHLSGLVAYTKDVDTEFWEIYRDKFEEIRRLQPAP